MKKWLKYFQIAAINMQNGLTYWADFVGRSLFFMIIISVMTLLWKTIYSGKTTIEGYTLNQMIWYLLVTEAITLSGQNVYRTVSNDVKTGDIAYLLNKPYHYIAYQFSCFSGATLIGLTINVIIGLGMGLIYVGPLPNLSIISCVATLLSIALGMTLDFFINMAIALSAFWVEENDPFRWIYQKLVFTLGGMLLPLELFPNWLQEITHFLPFAYITYGPAKLFVDFSTSRFFWILSSQGIYTVLAITICVVIYKKGVVKLNVNGG